MSRRSIITICFGLPLLLLVGAYLHMAVRYEKIWLFNTIVHENGKYTLFQVIFYFRHFLWEAPIKITYAVFLVGLFFYYGNPVLKGYPASRPSISNHLIIFGFLFAFLLLITAFIFAADGFGFQEALRGFLQYRRSGQSELMFGSHWRNHFLSNIVLFCSSAASLILFHILTNNGQWMKRRFSMIFYMGAALFILITLFFGLNFDPFSTPSYLGHQLREVFGSDTTITMLLSVGLLLYLEGKYDENSGIMNHEKRISLKKAFGIFTAWAVPAVGITLFLVIKVLSLDISSEIVKICGTKEWSKMDLFAWHFFEHSLDYIFILCLVGSFYLLALKNEFKSKE